MACRLASKCSQTVKSVTCCAGFRSTTEIILIPYGSHATCQYLNGTGSWQVFRGREVRAWDFYLACVGRERKESFRCNVGTCTVLFYPLLISYYRTHFDDMFWHNNQEVCVYVWCYSMYTWKITFFTSLFPFPFTKVTPSPSPIASPYLSIS